MTEKNPRRITVDPITRLEGHGKIDIFLNDEGNVDKAYFQIPELRGFEIFSLGRPAEDMPQITSRICGVCPMAHHMAATKALDDLYKVEPTEPAKKIRELAYNAFMHEDHALHVYILGGPDFIVGPDAPPALRNVVGVIEKVGLTHRIEHFSNQLSGGEQQRVAIARAIVNNPSIIFADEPTGNLDSKSGQIIMQILQNINDQGNTIILVTHEQDTAEHAKRIIKLKDGKMISDQKVLNRKLAKNHVLKK